MPRKIRRTDTRNVEGTFLRKGKCVRCGKACSRVLTITAHSFEEMMEQSLEWTEPLRHRKCEKEDEVA